MMQNAKEEETMREKQTAEATDFVSSRKGIRLFSESRKRKGT
jgi:hypothetical protein